jgi:hypothetical protein
MRRAVKAHRNLFFERMSQVANTGGDLIECSSNSRFKSSVRFVFVALFSSRGQETIFLTHRYFLVKTMQIGKIDRLSTCPQLF